MEEFVSDIVTWQHALPATLRNLITCATFDGHVDVSPDPTELLGSDFFWQHHVDPPRNLISMLRPQDDSLEMLTPGSVRDH